MKVGVITDTHFGVYKGSSVFLESSLKFFRNFLIPELKKRNINTIFHCGDMFDNRSSLDIKVINEVLKLFREDLKEFNVYIVVGNHDSVFKNTIEVNSVEVLRGYENVKVISEPTVFGNVGFVPWVVDKSNFESFINENKPEIVVGHFEIFGGKFLGTVDKNKDHIHPDFFDGKTKLVLSGHYHTRSEIKTPNCSIHYIGNCYHLDRGDEGEQRGMCILDTESFELEFVDDYAALKYIKLVYPQSYTQELIEGNIINVHVDISKEGYNEKDFGEYVSGIESFNPSIPPYVRIERTNFEEVAPIDISGTGSTIDILFEYVNQLNLENNLKEKIQEKAEKIYKKIKKEEIK